MKCPHCGMEVNENEEKCPYCYGILKCGDPENCELEHEDPAYSEESENEAPAPGAPEKKSRRRLIPLIIAGVILAAALILLLVPDGLFKPKNSGKIAAEYQGEELTNQQFNYYYWTEVLYYLSTTPSPEFDMKTPLSEQKYSEDQTWTEHFTEQALSNWKDITAVCKEADKKGFELPQKAADTLEHIEENLQAAAEQAGKDSPEEYLHQTYGKASDVKSFRAFLEKNYIANGYSDEIYNSLYEDNAIVIGEERTVNVRHILIGAEDKTPEEAAAKADELYKKFMAEKGDEELFAKYASENSQDPGSASAGGLYANVRKGHMVPEFDAWCFDGSRKPGDTGIVKSPYGSHIMYFSGEGEPYALTDTSKVSEAYTNWLDGIAGGELKINSDNIEIFSGK